MRSFWPALVLMMALVLPNTSRARRSDVHAYRYDQLWRSVVRLVRVDYGFPVRDRDEEVGYLLFDYVDSGRTHPGSFELVRVEEDGQEQVRVAVQVNSMPSYVERMLLDRLERKLRDEYGQPIRPPRPPQNVPEREEDEDDDDSEEENEDNNN